MSITRKLLKGMGLTDEQQDTIMEAHLETVNGLKSDIDKYKGDAEKLPAVQKELDDLKAKGDDGWKDKHDKVKKEFDQYKADQDAKAALGIKKEAFLALAKSELDPENTGELKESRLKTVVNAALANGVINGMELDENGTVKDVDKLKETIKAEFPDFVIYKTTQGADIAHPPTNTGGGTLTKADIYKKDDKGRYVMTATERQRALIDNKLL